MIARQPVKISDLNKRDVSVLDISDINAKLE